MTLTGIVVNWQSFKELLVIFLNLPTGCSSKRVRWWKFRVQLCNLAATIVSFFAPVAGFGIMSYEAKIPTFLGSISVNMESSWAHLMVFVVFFVLQAFMWCVVPVSFCIMVGSMCCGTCVSMAGYLSCLNKWGLLINQYITALCLFGYNLTVLMPLCPLKIYICITLQL